MPYMYIYSVEGDGDYFCLLLTRFFLLKSLFFDLLIESGIDIKKKILNILFYKGQENNFVLISVSPCTSVTYYFKQFSVCCKEFPHSGSRNKKIQFL